MKKPAAADSKVLPWRPELPWINCAIIQQLDKTESTGLLVVVGEVLAKCLLFKLFMILMT